MPGADLIRWCRQLATYSENPHQLTRTYLSEPMQAVHADLRSWMERLGMRVTIDAAGNLRGVYPGENPDSPRLLIGSHLDTVINAGAFDGPLGVVMGIALVDSLEGRHLPYPIEVIGFSEEEGMRFRVPFIGSRALVGSLDDELIGLVTPAIRNFGLDPARLPDAVLDSNAGAYLEFHIEQGPVLEQLGCPLGIVEAIAGQSRCSVCFEGHANHAGTTPMGMRRDALTGAAEWICRVEREAVSVPGLVATVGRCEVEPGAVNVIPGIARVSLDLRHADAATRLRALDHVLECAEEIAARRGLCMTIGRGLDQPAVAMDPALCTRLEEAVRSSGYPVHRMASGAGHDAMIVAARVPSAMLFLRTPGGISHHPDETVLAEDIDAALAVGRRFLEQWQ